MTQGDSTKEIIHIENIRRNTLNNFRVKFLQFQKLDKIILSCQVIKYDKIGNNIKFIFKTT